MCCCDIQGLIRISNRARVRGWLLEVWKQSTSSRTTYGSNIPRIVNGNCWCRERIFRKWKLSYRCLFHFKRNEHLTQHISVFMRVKQDIGLFIARATHIHAIMHMIIKFPGSKHPFTLKKSINVHVDISYQLKAILPNVGQVNKCEAIWEICWHESSLSLSTIASLNSLKF